MDKITLDSGIRSRLNGLKHPVEMCDEQGATVGVLVSPEVYDLMMGAVKKDLFADIDIEEAREEVRREGGYTTAEVLSRLQATIEQANKQA